MSTEAGLWRILYIQHAGSMGGSVYSLAYLIEGLDPQKYEPIVACIHDSESVIKTYQSRGVETFYWSGISDFPHTTLGWYPLYNPLAAAKFAKRIINFWPSVKATENLIRRVKPDLVHLNSLVLAPSAIGVKRCRVPLVWHVREPVHPGHLGIRKWLLSMLVKNYADEVIFICQNDQHTLVGNRKGVVIYNFVHFDRFDHTLDGKPVRDELGLLPNDKVILFLGGQGLVKGIFPLLKAMPLVKRLVPEVRCLIAGGKYEASGRLSSRIARRVFPLVGWGTVTQRMDKLMDRYSMHNYVHMLPGRDDVERLIAACDVVAFPSIEPHFARPVIEAGAMAKPVVASCIGGVEELVEDHETGILVEPGDVGELAQALTKVLCSQSASEMMGQKALQRAREFYDADRCIKIISGIYDDLMLNRNGPGIDC